MSSPRLADVEKLSPPRAKQNALGGAGGGCGQDETESCTVRLRRLVGQWVRSLNRYWYVVGVPLGSIAWFRLDFLSVVCATAAQGSKTTRANARPIFLRVRGSMLPIPLS